MVEGLRIKKVLLLAIAALLLIFVGCVRRATQMTCVRPDIADKRIVVAIPRFPDSDDSQNKFFVADVETAVKQGLRSHGAHIVEEQPYHFSVAPQVTSAGVWDAGVIQVYLKMISPEGEEVANGVASVAYRTGERIGSDIAAVKHAARIAAEEFCIMEVRGYARPASVSAQAVAPAAPAAPPGVVQQPVYQGAVVYGTAPMYDSYYGSGSVVYARGAYSSGTVVVPLPPPPHVLLMRIFGGGRGGRGQSGPRHHGGGHRTYRTHRR